MLKRLSAAFLAALMLAQMVACSDTPEDDVPDTSAADTSGAAVSGEDTTTAETELSDNLPEKKLDGWEFRVYSSDTSGLCINDPLEEIGEEINDAFYRRNLELEERFDFELTITSEPEKNYVVTSTLKTSSMAGDNTYQLYLGYTTKIVDFIPYLLPINNLKYVDATKDWWYPETSKVFNIDGVQLALSGCFDLSIPSKVQCQAFNKELAAELKLDKSLYDLARDGEWTLDKFAEVTAQLTGDVNGDGAMDENDLYGIQGNWKACAPGYINAMGVAFATTDEDGYPVFKGGKDEALVEAIQHLQKLYTNYPYLYHNTAQKVYQYTGAKSFAAEGTIFTSTEMSAISGSLRDLDFEIGILPNPKLTAEQDRYYCQTAYGHSPIVCNSLPRDQWDNVGMLMEAFAFNTYTELLPVYKEKTLKTKNASDAESADMVDIIWNSAFYDFGVLCWEEKLSNLITTELFINGSESVVSYLTSLEPTLQQQSTNIREAVTALKENVE